LEHINALKSGSKTRYEFGFCIVFLKREKKKKRKRREKEEKHQLPSTSFSWILFFD